MSKYFEIINLHTSIADKPILKGLNLAIDKGEIHAIMGPNGSGKSTLLKILARVMYPEGGSVTMNGKVACFLELGVGFQPELTAKENVYIYSSILGISRREVNKVYDEIFDFAELRRFESMKLKNFSSGMYMRLAFSVAIFTQPDILLVDEILAVGDSPFQVKCIKKMEEFKKLGVTTIFVSHSLDTVRHFCSRVIYLKEGRVEFDGEVNEGIDKYIKS